MIKLEDYISGLLYQYECVIIPGFGGFIANYRPSRLEYDQGIIYPPSVELAFNPALKNNDGLLANFIAETEKISYTGALAEISHEVEKWNYFLLNGETVFLKNIGELTFNEDEKVLFSPYQEVNYLQDSFGFNPVKISLVNRKKTGIREEYFDRNLKTTSRINHRRNIVYYSLMAYIPILCLLWFYLISKEPFGNNDLGSFDLLKQTEINLDKPKVSENPLTPKENSGEKQSDLKQIYIDDANTRAKGLQPRYYIIGGSFGTFQNAVIFRDVLLVKKYKSEILQSGDGKYRVAYYSFEFGEEAMTYLKQVRKKENPSAWIVKQ